MSRTLRLRSNAKIEKRWQRVGVCAENLLFRLNRLPPGHRHQRNATLAQLVERLIRNQQVASSILAGGSRL